MRKKIKFENVKQAEEFVKKIEGIEADINLYDGRMALDAKSILAIMNLDFSKEFEVEIVTNNPIYIMRFEESLEEL